MNSHALRFVPGSNVARLCQALASASWQRSSASSRCPHKVRAKARKNGISSMSLSRKSSPPAMLPLGVVGSMICWAIVLALAVAAFIDLLQQIEQLVRDGLFHNVVVPAPQLLTDQALPG